MNKIKNLAAWLWRKFRAFWPWYKNLYQGKAWYTKTLIGIASCIVAFILYLGAVDINFLWLFGKSPGFFSGITNPQTSEASEIYSADGKLIGKYFNENRTPVKYEEVNPAFFKALVDTEDERFYKHLGIDPIGLFGAMKDALLHHDARGASTITQQLAKNMFRVRSQYSTGLLGKVPGLRILIIKSKEWIIAAKLEAVYTKKEIITMYANTVDFGSNSYGIKTAAKTYFNVSPKELTTDQAAVLVGMLKATTYYNPRTNPEHSLERRNVVLNNMVRHGDLSREEYNTLSQEPIKLDFKVEENYDGQAKYFREAVADYLADWCKDEGYDLYTSGLKIYTTIDTRMQKYAEDAARKQMRQVQQNFNNHWDIYRKQDTNWLRQEPWQDEKHQVIPNFIQGIAERQPFYKALIARFPNNPDSVNYYYKEWVHPVKVFDYDKGTITKMMTSEDSIKYMTTFMHCAFVAMEPQTGAVKAWVGDIDFDHWKYDKVTAERQPGSTFKLFVYTEATDSRQIFAELPIGTAAPTAEQQKRVKHYFVGNRHIEDYYSAAQYEADVMKLLKEDIFKNHDVALLTGGSMMYIDAVCNGIDDIPTVRDDIREWMKARLANEGLDTLVEELKNLDPEHWAIVDKKNPRRVVHALEICHQTGKTYTSFRTNKKKSRPFRIVKIGLNRDRSELYDRINQRVHVMMQEGLEAEARGVYAYRDQTALRTVGYKEMFAYFDGTIDLHEAVRQIQSHSREYMRKQLTWFKRDETIQWFHPDNIKEIIKYVDSCLKME